MRPVDTSTWEVRTLEIERLLSRREVREVLGVSTVTIARMVASGDLPVVRVGARTLIDPADLRAYIAARKSRLNDDDPAGTGSTVRAPAEAGGGDDAA
jgi:excisionase family DNA binding protein